MHRQHVDVGAVARLRARRRARAVRKNRRSRHCDGRRAEPCLSHDGHLYCFAPGFAPDDGAGFIFDWISGYIVAAPAVTTSHGMP